MKGFARQRSQRFNWNKLVSAYTGKDFISFCENAQKDINAKNMMAASIPKEIPKIDWAHWKSAISAPGVVDQLQKEYESIVFEDQSADQFNSMKQANLHQVAIAEASLGATKTELGRADKAIQALQEMKRDGVNWDADKWCANIPGLEGQLKEAFENEDYLPNDEEEKIAALDFKDVEKDFVGATLEGEPSTAIGDLNMKEEKDLINAGEWSVGRLFVDREGREALLEEVRKSNRDAQAQANALKEKA
jgi:hypothetical protein